MAATDPTQSQRVINYKEIIPLPDSAVLDGTLHCVGGHGKSVVRASLYSRQLYCQDCLTLSNHPKAPRCQCCNAAVGYAPEKEFSNCIKILGTKGEIPDYICAFCWADRVTPEEHARCTKLARTWFQSFLLEASRTYPKLKWTLSAEPDIQHIQMAAMLSWGGFVCGTTQSEQYNKTAGEVAFIHHVRILSNLSKLQFLVVTVHELTHCWQEENGITLSKKGQTTYEGFAEWVSYKFLLWYWKGTKKEETKKEIQGLAQMKRLNTSYYGKGLRDWIVFEQQKDVATFMAEVATTKQL